MWSSTQYVWSGDGTAPDADAYTNIIFIDPTGLHDPATSTGGRSNPNDLWETGGGNPALDPEFAAIAGLTSAADRLPYFTGSGTASLATFTTTARAILDDTSNAAVRTTIGVAPIAVKSTTPVAADYNESTIPTGAIWVQSP